MLKLDYAQLLYDLVIPGEEDGSFDVLPGEEDLDFWEACRRRKTCQESRDIRVYVRPVIYREASFSCEEAERIAKEAIHDLVETTGHIEGWRYIPHRSSPQHVSRPPLWSFLFELDTEGDEPRVSAILVDRLDGHVWTKDEIDREDLFYESSPSSFALLLLTKGTPGHQRVALEQLLKEQPKGLAFSLRFFLKHYADGADPSLLEEIEQAVQDLESSTS